MERADVIVRVVDASGPLEFAPRTEIVAANKIDLLDRRVVDCAFEIPEWSRFLA